MNRKLRFFSDQRAPNGARYFGRRGTALPPHQSERREQIPVEIKARDDLVEANASEASKCPRT